MVLLLLLKVIAVAVVVFGACVLVAMYLLSKGGSK